MIDRKVRTVLIVIAAILLLTALKFFLASLSGSIALKASAWHSLSDLVPSFVVLLGFIIARREDTRATQGISRVENIIAIIVSCFIFYVGIEIMRDVFGRHAEELSNVPLTAAISLLTIAINYFMCRYQIYVGKEVNSPGLIANGTHARVDMYSSMVVVAALVGYIAGFASLDKIAGVVIALLIFSNGFEVFTGAIKALRHGGFLESSHVHVDLLAGKFQKIAQRFAVVMVILALLGYCASGFYSVRWNEKAMVKRLGKVVRQTDPGIHYRLPWPLEVVDRVKLGDVRVEKIPSSVMLTGDENFVEIEAVAQYQVKDAFAFIYNLADHEEMVRTAAQSSVRDQINRNPVEYVLTEGKGTMQKDALSEAQDILDKQNSGIRLLALQITKFAPPSDVMDAFRDVASASEDRATFINEALGYQAEVVPKARGEAQKLVEKATAYRAKKINTVRGDAQRFLSKLHAYQKSRDITRKRLYIEALEKVLANATKFIVHENIKVDNTELWFVKDDLGRKFIEEVRKP